MYRRRPVLVAFKGHPGVGKSAIARALGRHLAIALIDKDDIKDILSGQCADAGGLAYTVMFNIARRQLMQGLNTICDSPLSEPGGYTTACCVAHDTAAQLIIIECICSSPAEWRRRIERRSALRLPAHHVTSWDDLEAHLQRRAQTSSYPINHPHLTVDTMTPFDDILKQILNWLESEGISLRPLR